MAQISDPLDVDRLYVALTRPPMLFGVTDIYFVFLLIVEVCIFVGVGGGRGIAYAFALFFPIYWLGRAACAIDPRIFSITLIKLSKFSKASMQRDYWGGTTFSPD